MEEDEEGKRTEEIYLKNSISFHRPYSRYVE
jgi:hypothetical protein